MTIDYARKRRLARFLGIAQPTCDAIGLGLILLFFLRLVPAAALSPNPATGGDTGSHFWPLVTLVQHALPNLSLRVWNPGNLGGEPHFVHYFPFAYWVMALLSLVMPLGTAFNVGTLLPLLLFPVAVYFGIKLSGHHFPTPLLSALLSLCFLYNESFSIWGGNALSVLAGQFSHLYALAFLVLGVGLLAWENRQRRFPYYSALCFAALSLSHAYVMVGLPFLLLSFVCFSVSRNVRTRLLIGFTSGTLALLLSMWFLVPMVDNAVWTTAYSFKWLSNHLLSEVFSEIFVPILVLLPVSLLLLIARTKGRRTRRVIQMSVAFWLLPTLGYAGLYYVFPAVGLVDVRALPQVELFLCLLTATLVGAFLERRKIVAFLVILPLTSLTLYWVDLHVKTLPLWLEWNYSGWVSKPAYPDLMRLADALRGNFSMPRVIYEQSDLNNRAGTERVFEMLPYFAHRATLESVYLQASILAPAAFLLQAEVSKTPSCPFSQYGCASYNLGATRGHLQLLGVGDLILLTPELVTQARAADFLTERGSFGQWTLFHVTQPPSLVDVFTRAPLLSTDEHWRERYRRPAPAGGGEVPVDANDWKDLFYHWLKDYSPTEPMILVDREHNAAQIPAEAWSGGAECAPTLEVGFSRMVLTTPCPGRAHYLKFAYHSSWQADTRDALYLVSPGFVALVPSQSRVVLTFGHSALWQAAGAVSSAALILMVALPATLRRRTPSSGGHR